MTDLVEIDFCDFCHEKKQVERKYYYYPFNCECCGGQYHFQYVRHCKDCEPKPPKWIQAKIKPIQENTQFRNKFNPESWEYYG